MSKRVGGGRNIVPPDMPPAFHPVSPWPDQDLKQPEKWGPHDTEQSKLGVGVNVRTKRERTSVVH